MSKPLQEYITELRHENARYRRRAKEVEAKASEIERRLILAELKLIAVAAGLIDPGWMEITDLSGLRLNDAGEIEGALEFIEVMKRGKPHLFKKGHSA